MFNLGTEKTKESVAPESNNAQVVCPIKLIVPSITTSDIRAPVESKHSSFPEL